MILFNGIFRRRTGARAFGLSRHARWGGAWAAFACGLCAPSLAHAASLSGPITGWASGVPSYISMYEYVPANLAANAPVLVVSHYCGGNAAGVFGEAQGGGIVAAADKYGFLMIFPQTSNNCWDVGSTKSLTHDGGGDTQAIAEMVKYSLTKHNANPNRVYATGTSSGAMMTEALLATYPDVFKAGAEFSGVAAGCWNASYSASNQWSGPCAGGTVSHTAQQWGDLVRAMDPGFSGHRPRVQLWHGTADATINYNNQTEAIKEWTNVLGLSTTPNSTTTVSLNNHQWTRQSWQDSCGFTVLDAWAEQNGPHGTDANLNATYVIPFLGLDKSGATDPDACGSSGGAGSGGSGGSSAGGANGGNGSGGANSGGTSSGGGTGVSGGSSSSGASGVAGSNAGGSAGTASGGASSGVGGANAAGNASGGQSSGGTSAGGASTSTAGASHAGAPGSAGSNGGSVSDAGSAAQGDSTSSGCSCHVAGSANSSGSLALALLGICAGIWRGRRRSKRAAE